MTVTITFFSKIQINKINKKEQIRQQKFGVNLRPCLSTWDTVSHVLNGIRCTSRRAGTEKEVKRDQNPNPSIRFTLGKATSEQILPHGWWFPWPSMVYLGIAMS